jgi:hypothetical protein
MSTYNGRKVMADVAEAHGWIVTGPLAKNGLEYVTYELGDDWYMIGWTPENSAPVIFRGGLLGSDPVRIPGPRGLIRVREAIEASIYQVVHD